MSSRDGACISLRTLAMKSLDILRKLMAVSIHCFMLSRNCGERMNSSHDCASAWKIPLRISFTTSGGGELLPNVNAVCMILDIESIQIFWKAAACSAVFSKLSLIVSIRNGAARMRQHDFQRLF